MMPDLACLLISQEIFPQLAVITDTPRLRKFPCETNILRDISAHVMKYPGYQLKTGYRSMSADIEVR